MELITLGIYGAFPGKNNACMGQLIRTKNTNVLIDCGSGVLSRLLNHLDIKYLDAVILTHLHDDHISDIYLLNNAIKLGMMYDEGFKRLNVYCPFDNANKLELLQKETFILNEIKEETIRIGDINISFKETLHNVKTFAIMCKHNDKKIGYTSDTGYLEELIPFFRDCDILVGECSLFKSQELNTPYHMTTEKVVKLANKSNVKKLLLTHFWYQYEPTQYLLEAEMFNDQCIVEIAGENQIYK